MAATSPAELQQLLASLNDAVKSYDGKGGPLEAETRAKIRGEARKVFLSMMSPDEMGIYHYLDFMELIAIRTCMELGIFEHMPEGRPIPLEDLAAAANIAPIFLQRILRILIAVGFIDQTHDGGDYMHTKFSLAYRDPMKPSAGALFKACYYLFLQNHARFHEYITTELEQPYPEPDSIINNSINWHLGNSDRPILIGIATQTPEIMRSFQCGMSVFDGEVPPAGPFYDFAQLADKSDPERVQICDIGGGAGQVITKIIAATPDLDPKRCVLQDVPAVLELATRAKEMGVQIVSHDFHQEQRVKGARAYYLRFILHDYNDKQAIEILTHTAAAMAPDSVVLVYELLMPDRRLDEAALTVGVLDQGMLAIGGKERTVREFEALFDASGLRLTNVYHVPGRNGAVLEAKLKAR